MKVLRWQGTWFSTEKRLEGRARGTVVQNGTIEVGSHEIKQGLVEVVRNGLLFRYKGFEGF